jgi:hypothetical protein
MTAEQFETRSKKVRGKRSPSTFKQGDVTRAVKGAVAAGVDVAKIEIDAAGKITVVTVRAPGIQPDQGDEKNEWDSA